LRGAGIINTRVLNEALLLKWIWRLYNYEEGDMCCELPLRKYLLKKPLATCKLKWDHNFGKA
jgi:hypothetical protein